MSFVTVPDGTRLYYDVWDFFSSIGVSTLVIREEASHVVNDFLTRHLLERK